MADEFIARATGNAYQRRAERAMGLARRIQEYAGHTLRSLEAGTIARHYSVTADAIELDKTLAELAAIQEICEIYDSAEVTP